MFSFLESLLALSQAGLGSRSGSHSELLEAAAAVQTEHDGVAAGWAIRQTLTTVFAKNV